MTFDISTWLKWGEPKSTFPFWANSGSTSFGGRMPQPTRIPGEKGLEKVPAWITRSPSSSRACRLGTSSP